MELQNKAAYTDDGYIVNQACLHDVRYGCRTSDCNGCGWIAAYNFLRSLADDAPEEEVARALSSHALFRGLLGTSPFRLRRYLKRRGYAIHSYIGPKKVVWAAETARAGILLYRHSSGWHFVAFVRVDARGGLRFFNASPGNAQHILSMQTFLTVCNRTPLCYLLSVQ
ncbi:MAG: hypothetical protein RRZ24_02060 [Clostridia bacterium]